MLPSSCGPPAANWGAKDEEGRFVLPAGVPAESSQLSTDGAYLLDNGRIFLLWLGHSVQRDFVAQVPVEWLYYFRSFLFVRERPIFLPATPCSATLSPRCLLLSLLFPFPLRF